MIEQDPEPGLRLCRKCEHEIYWGDIGWVHDDTGFAECGTVVKQIGVKVDGKKLINYRVVPGKMFAEPKED